MSFSTEIRDLKIFEALPGAVAEALCADAEELDFDAGDCIAHQHDEARSLFILLSGTVEFLIKAEGIDDLFVGAASERGALLGWSIVREPHRYTATVRCTQPCRVLRLPRRPFERILANDPQAHYAILQAIAEAVANRLQDALGLLGAVPGTGPRQ